MHDDLDILLILVFLYQNLVVEKKDRKGFRKAVIKLINKVPKIVKQEILDDILEAPEREIWSRLDGHVTEYLNVVPTAHEISEMGCQGMIFHKEFIYPVEIFVLDKDDRDWACLHEEEVILTAIDGLMKLLEQDQIECRVLLFKNKGFSGLIYNRQVIRGAANERSRVFGDGKFFK